MNEDYHNRMDQYRNSLYWEWLILLAFRRGTFTCICFKKRVWIPCAFAALHSLRTLDLTPLLTCTTSWPPGYLQSQDTHLRLLLPSRAFTGRSNSESLSFSSASSDSSSLSSECRSFIIDLNGPETTETIKYTNEVHFAVSQAIHPALYIIENHPPCTVLGGESLKH